MGKAPGFPAMRARQLRRLLEKELGYSVIRTKGSHRRMEAEGRPALTFAFHDADTVAPSLVRSILTRQAGLTLDEAQEVIARG
jgi:predicted RNA binding protein YcfA (HicA-like mRNA interferase family)